MADIEVVMKKLDSLVSIQERIEHALQEMRAEQHRLATGLASHGQGRRRSQCSGQQDPSQESTRGADEKESDMGRLHSFGGYGPSEEQSGREGAHFVAATLPMNWPASLKVRAVSFTAGTTSNAGVFAAAKTTMGARTQTFATLHESTNDSNRKWMLDPESQGFHVYKSLSIFVLLWDIVSVPFLLAWDIDVQAGVLAVAGVTATFWTMDTFLPLATGFYHDGELVRSPRLTFLRCLKGTLLPRLVLVCCDWAMLAIILAESTDYFPLIARGARVGMLRRLLSIGRLMRACGLMLLGSLEKVLSMTFFPAGVSQGKALAMRAFSSMLLLVLVGHFIACLWYAIGRVGYSDTGYSWVEDLASRGPVDFNEAPITYQYLTSLHWATAQLTLGAMEVHCSSTYERMFNCFCLLGALLGGSMLISSLSAMLVQYQMEQRDRTNQVRLLAQFCKENGVEARVARLAHMQIEERMGKHDLLTDGDVKAIALLSSSVRSELRLQAFMPVLSAHPLFNLWTCVDMVTFNRLCRDAIAFMHLRSQDELFHVGSHSDMAYRLLSGGISYHQDPDSSPVLEPTTKQVEVKEWLSEAALWCHWLHVGTAIAGSPCKLVTVRADALHTAMCGHRVVRMVAEEYINKFFKALVDARPPDAEWPDDLHVPRTAFDELALSMDGAMQQMISAIALDSNHLSFWHRQKTQKVVQSLRRQAENGTAIVTMIKPGDLQCLVADLLLRVEGIDNRLLVQVARGEQNHVTVMCTPPKVRLRPIAQETLTPTFAEELLRAHFPVLAPHLEVTDLRTDYTESLHKEIKFRTKTQSIVVTAKLVNKLDHHLVPVPYTSAAGDGTVTFVDISQRPTRWRGSLIGAASNRPASPAAGRQSMFSRVSASMNSSMAYSIQPLSTGGGQPHSRQAPRCRGSEVLSPEPRASAHHGSSSSLCTSDVQLEVLLSREIYAMPIDGAIGYMAWLTEGEVETLGQPSSRSVVQTWLGRLDHRRAQNMHASICGSLVSEAPASPTFSLSPPVTVENTGWQTPKFRSPASSPTGATAGWAYLHQGGLSPRAMVSSPVALTSPTWLSAPPRRRSSSDSAESRSWSRGSAPESDPNSAKLQHHSSNKSREVEGGNRLPHVTEEGQQTVLSSV